jgi:hypothetical protein
LLSDADFLDLVEGNAVSAPIVEAGDAGRLVVGHLLGDFEFAAVLEIGGNARGAEGTEPKRWFSCTSMRDITIFSHTTTHKC